MQTENEHFFFLRIMKRLTCPLGNITELASSDWPARGLGQMKSVGSKDTFFLETST